MKFTIDMGNGVNVLVLGDVLKTAKAISYAHPGEEVNVFACDHGRLTILDGEVIEDIADIRERVCLLNYEAEIEHLLIQQWRDLDTGFLQRRLTPQERAEIGKRRDLFGEEASALVDIYKHHVHEERIKLTELLDSYNIENTVDV
jgi:hypothetical protein